MLSRVEVRRRLEYVLRAIVLAALVGLLWLSLRPPVGAAGTSIAARGVTAGELAIWSRAPIAPRRIDLRLDSVPSRVERAWLAALAAAGSQVGWSGDLPPVMAEVEPIARPGGGMRVGVAAPTGTSVAISDDIGAIDTVQIRNAGATVTLAGGSDSIVVRANGSVASALLRDSLVLRKVLVIGAAGWETKFAAAALEEEGWKVDVLARVAPAAEVTTGTVAPIDTSRYSAVIALDATAAPYAARLSQYVRSGGG
ncbi:MAG TPA: hypothetical protein VJ825_10770, partial [Gemmatimonadaceae bacterium]|nr:hypothetical protein [Gemmatimonadaceae bacterium]